MTVYYKCLTDNDCSPFQNTPWNLPHNGQPGEWMPRVEGDLSKCQRGYHGVADDQCLLRWIDAHIYELEYREPPQRDHEKCWGAQARLVRRVFAETWTEQSARLLACRIAEDVLPIFERVYPDDFRPRQAIEVARRFAAGTATNAERAAARAAAWNAAGAAARAAAGAAARAAAGAAAGAADAAWNAAGAAAGAADAAWDAALAAAWNAAWAADAAADAVRAKYEQWLWEMLGVME